MVGTVIVVLVILGLGAYFLSQQSPSVKTATTTDTGGTPNGQTQVNSNPGADYQPSQTSTTSTPAGTTVDTSATAGVTTGAASMAVTVSYDGKAFTPASVTIAKGGTVTFKDTAGRMWVASNEHPTHTAYDGTSRQQHCAAGATLSFDQCLPGSSYSFTFNKSGSWDYHDHLNPAAEAVVIVK